MEARAAAVLRGAWRGLRESGVWRGGADGLPSVRLPFCYVGRL